MKGLILCAGFGTRLRPLTYTGAKHLLPVANKPILNYAIEAMAQAGIEEIGLVVGGPTRQQIQEAVGDGSRFGVRASYIAQEHPHGLAHAVAVAADFIGDSPFVVYLGDNMIHGGITEFVESFGGDAAAQILVAKVEDPRRFGVAETKGGKVVRLIEKPSTMEIDLAIVGVYAFTPEVFGAIDRIEPSARGELEITDAIQRLVDDGKTVRAVEVRSWWADTGRPEDVLEVNRRLLHEVQPRIEGEVGAESEVVGPVVIGPGSEIRGSMIRGPVIIGSDCIIEDCYIGPYTAISDNCTLRDTEVEFSILLTEVQISDMPLRIDRSLLGTRVKLTRNDSPARALQFVLGNDSHVVL
jgi:glucose-1-phosphate thymidylyltransferase